MKIKYKHSPETKQRISEALKGHIVSQETKQKISKTRIYKKIPIWSQGLTKNTHSSLKKLSNILMGHTVSEETRKKIGDAGRGKIISKETRRKLSLALRGRKLPPVSDETRRKMSDARRGKLCCRWKGGMSSATTIRLGRWVWKKLAIKIRKRDNHWCLYCRKQRGEIVHHMLPVRLGGKDNEENLVTLCKSCHSIIEVKIVC